MSAGPPITEADLHACIDGLLSPERQREVESYLSGRPEERQRFESYRAQKQELRALFDPVLDEILPHRVLRAAQPRIPWYARRLVAGIAIAMIGGAAGWGLRGGLPAEFGSATLAQKSPGAVTLASAAGFAQRAAVAHAVYSPDQRRPVEVDAAHEDQLVAWLSKRMGVPMKPPRLEAVGYALEGGRLLPGGQGPVAQFMYRNTQRSDDGGKLTLYVSNEILNAVGAKPDIDAKARNTDTAFRFLQQGQVNVFYWIDGPFGYAISADADRSTLARVSDEVYRQLAAAR